MIDPSQWTRPGVYGGVAILLNAMLAGLVVFGLGARKLWRMHRLAAAQEFIGPIVQIALGLVLAMAGLKALLWFTAFFQHVD